MQCASPERQHTKGLDDGESFHNVLRESLLKLEFTPQAPVALRRSDAHGAALRLYGWPNRGFPQRPDDRAGKVRFGVLALGHEVFEDSLHPLEVRQFRLDLRQPVGSDASDGPSIGAVLQLQQFSHLFERETELLRPLDEADPLDQAQRVIAERSFALWHRQELSVLVVADRLHSDVGGAGEPADGE